MTSWNVWGPFAFQPWEQQIRPSPEVVYLQCPPARLPGAEPRPVNNFWVPTEVGDTHCGEPGPPQEEGLGTSLQGCSFRLASWGAFKEQRIHSGVVAGSGNNSLCILINLIQDRRGQSWHCHWPSSRVSQVWRERGVCYSVVYSDLVSVYA